MANIQFKVSLFANGFVVIFQQRTLEVMIRTQTTSKVTDGRFITGSVVAVPLRSQALTDWITLTL